MSSNYGELQFNQVELICKIDKNVLSAEKSGNF